MTDIGKIEYRVKRVERYFVTRYEESADRLNASGVREIGSDYADADMAYAVAYALCRQEHERLGFPPGDMRIIYPEHPNMTKAVMASKSA